MRLLPMLVLSLSLASAAGIESRVSHGYADSSGVKIHYASLGQGPLVVFIHGFPDFWYTWRDQMDGLAKQYQTVAIDLRGYNLSDKPKGVENYDMTLLVGDVAAVIRHLGRDKAIIAGHDWGGAIAWAIAAFMPQMCEKLIICNLPHPRLLARELARNPEQQKNSQYARDFQQEGAHLKLTPEALTFWVTDPKVKEKYIEAFKRSDFEAMLAYYKRNYPRPGASPDQVPIGKVSMPVLMIHGLKDSALLPGGLNDSWTLVDNDLTLVTIPNAGHFVQQDASDLVTRSIRMWLNR